MYSEYFPEADVGRKRDGKKYLKNAGEIRILKQILIFSIEINNVSSINGTEEDSEVELEKGNTCAVCIAQGAVRGTVGPGTR